MLTSSLAKKYCDNSSVAQPYQVRTPGAIKAPIEKS
jgi:hypothetical protein